MPLPRRVGVGEEHRDAGGGFELGVRRHLLSTVPGQRPGQLGRQRPHRRRQGVGHRDRPIAGQRGPVLDRVPMTVAFLAGQMDQHREPGRAFNHSADR